MHTILNILVYIGLIILSIVAIRIVIRRCVEMDNIKSALSQKVNILYADTNDIRARLDIMNDKIDELIHHVDKLERDDPQNKQLL